MRSILYSMKIFTFIFLAVLNSQAQASAPIAEYSQLNNLMDGKSVSAVTPAVKGNSSMAVAISPRPRGEYVEGAEYGFKLVTTPARYLLGKRSNNESVAPTIMRVLFGFGLFLALLGPAIIGAGLSLIFGC